MFSSLFGRKKGGDTPPEETDPIPSHNAPPAGGDEFIFVERKEPGPAPGPSGNVYPNLGGGGYLPPSGSRRQEQAPFHYLQDVPFKLCPQIASNETYETLQMELDSILALLTRKVHYLQDYDFATERSLSG